MLFLYYFITPLIYVSTYLYINSYNNKLYDNLIKVLSQYVPIFNITTLKNEICVKIIGNKEKVIKTCTSILKLNVYCTNYNLIQQKNKYILHLYIKPYAINNINKLNNTNINSNIIIIKI